MTESLTTDDPEPGSAPPRATAEQWRELVAAVLARSGRPSDDPERALTRTTLAGIDVHPLYTARNWPFAPEATGVPGGAPFVRGAVAERGWDVRQRHVAVDPARANAAIGTDLANGVNSVWLEVDSAEDVGPCLDGVALGETPVVLDAGPATLAAARAVLAGPGGAAWRGNVGADPVGWAHRRGGPAELAVAVEAFELSFEHPGLRAIVVDGTVFHEAGGTDVDELAITTAAGVAYLRALTDSGVTVVDALAALEFRFAVTDEQFSVMAKLRAARWMWNRVGEVCSAPESARGQRQHAVTSAAMMTRRAPYTNVLRATVAGFAAARRPLRWPRSTRRSGVPTYWRCGSPATPRRCCTMRSAWLASLTPAAGRSTSRR
jgi:methylmalonyl-CoA mutase